MAFILSKYQVLFATIMMLCFFLSPASSVAADSSAGQQPETLILSGTLDEIPETVMLCAPLNIKYSLKSTGTLPVSDGHVKIEIKKASSGRQVFTKLIQFTLKPSPVTIKNVEFPQGEYTIFLTAMAWNMEHNISRNFTLAKQRLTVSAPLLVHKQSNAAVLRVLVLFNQSGTPVQQAFSEKILKQAFEDNSIYYKIVDTAEDFTNEALTGIFNAAVLFEPDELLDQSAWLRDRIKLGQGLVIIGSENRSRMIAETFGFKFSDTLNTSGIMLQLMEDSGLGLSGTLPVTGRVLVPNKDNAKAAALFLQDKRPAILIDDVGKGQVIVIPFSLTRSAVDAGTTSVYSLILRAAVQSASAADEEQSDISSTELMVSAPAGPVMARVVETLPPGTKVIWTNVDGTVKDNTIIFDLVADKEPQKLQYLFRPPAGNKNLAFTEVFYECNDILVSQGTIE